ncbi:AEC family transporter [Candidatus Entotheonella serta]|nr:AEC family transporter [Candidatus Entotheonella serta]
MGNRCIIGIASENCLFFPAILAGTLIRSDLKGIPLGGLTATLFCSVFTMTVTLLALKPVLTRYGNMTGPTYTSLFQVSTRWNPFIALAIILKLFGAPGATLVAVAMVAMIPLINIENVCVLAAFIGKTIPPLSVISRTILLNPLILGCLIGLTINLLNLPVWAPVMTVVDLMGQAALGCSLLCIGAGLPIRHALSSSRDVWLGVLIKLFVMPLWVWGWATMFGLSGQAFQTVIVVAAVPAATNGYILARQMGGDAPLYAARLAVQTILLFISMPLLIYMAQWLRPLS